MSDPFQIVQEVLESELGQVPKGFPRHGELAGAFAALREARDDRDHLREKVASLEAGDKEKEKEIDLREDGKLVNVGEYECVTCTRCATTFAIVHPTCPRCVMQAEAAWLRHELEKAEEKLAQGDNEVTAIYDRLMERATRVERDLQESSEIILGLKKELEKFAGAREEERAKTARLREALVEIEAQSRNPYGDSGAMAHIAREVLGE